MALSVTDLENLELENGNLTAANCSILLAHYLLADDLLNAKYLWKRTPIATKKENEEINALWAMGKKLWAKDFAGFFNGVKQRQWTEPIVPLITELVNKTRQRVFRLICLAYTTIKPADLAAMIDLPGDEAINFAINPTNGSEYIWKLDAASQMLEKAPLVAAAANGFAAAMDTVQKHERQFQLLIDYVSFLEN